MTLLELAERCEAATGPDRDLDDTIVTVALFEDELGERDATPRFTASLDAAMTLVPPDIGSGDGDYWRPGVARTHRGTWAATLAPPWNGERNTRVFKSSGDEATPALALCAAALRARAA